MKRISVYICLLSLALGFTACEKYVDVPPPQNELPTPQVFSDDKTANAAVSGIYARMNAYNYQFTNAMSLLLPGMLADEVYYAFSTAAFDEMKNNSLTPANSYVRYMWDEPYSYIYHANALLEGLEISTGVSEAKKRQFMGEAYFVRAFCYFYLVNYFGRVPLITNTDYRVNTAMPRTGVDSVYTQILADLTEAQKLLEDNYQSAERTRPNKAVATALLARTYLYRNQWDLAEAEATKIITDTRYPLIDDLDGIFLKNSGEALWQLQTVNTSTAGVNTWEGFNIVPVNATARGYYNAYDSYVQSFETGDQRKDSYLNTYVTGTETFYYPYKYKRRTATPVSEYTMVMRSAEQYLIRAEARAQQNDLDGAREDLDAVRERAGITAPLSSTLNKDDLLLIVEEERRKELYAEWGHRWLDLKRTGRAVTVLYPEKPDIEEDDLLLPIPQTAIRTNNALEQNDGYF